MRKMTLVGAAREVLRDEPGGLTLREVFTRSVERGLVKPTGKTPLNSLRGNIYDHVKRHGENADFERVGEGPKWRLTRPVK